jgi:hypothetical protein
VRRWRDRLRWSGHRGESYIEVDLGMVNLPRMSLYGDESERHARVGLSWDNGNSDPVWAVYTRVPVPGFIGRRLKW